MIFDTDIIIWVQRGNIKASTLIDNAEDRYLSLQSYMELLQGAHNKQHHTYIIDFLDDYSFTLLPITEKISHRAAIYVEELSLTHGIRACDAIIAATAIEHNLELSTSNNKHFKNIHGLKLKVFKP